MLFCPFDEKSNELILQLSFKDKLGNPVTDSLKKLNHQQICSKSKVSLKILLS